MNKKKEKIPPLYKRFKNLLGAGPYIIFAGFILEGITLIIRLWISIRIMLSFESQIILTVICIALCLLGMKWFYCSLDLINVYLKNGECRLVTTGPFSYVRHPLYSILLFTLPSLMVIWFSDLLFLLPWILLFIVSHYIVLIEERRLLRIFGEDYRKYKEFVPALLPYKGAGGKSYHKQFGKV